MEFGLSFECSEAALRRALDLEVLKTTLQQELMSRNFGEGLDGIYIVCIAIEDASFMTYKKRKLLYKKGQRMVLPKREELRLGRCLLM